jgi:alkylation response protein AidB-like acyl-CoA dehydrogenase
MQFADIGISEEQVQLLDIATDFCRNRAGIERTRAVMTSDAGYDADLWEEIVALGWLGIAIPESQGGVGLSLAEVVPVVEQMGRHLVPLPFAATSVAAQMLIMAGNGEQQAEWLPQLASGAVGTVALAEAHADWDVTHVEAAATPVEGGFRLSGTKHFVLWAACSDIIIVSAAIEGEAALFLLRAQDVPAGALRRETIIDETKRSFALSLDGIVVSAAVRLDGGDTKQALRHVDLSATLLQSAEMCGGMSEVIAGTLDYLRTRKQFGKLIGEYQALKHPMVDAYIGYEKARSHLYSAAHVFAEQGQGEIAVRMAKAAADGAYAYVADRAIQFHGGFGFTHDCDAGLHRRAAIFHASQHGDAAWHRARLAELLFSAA